MLEMVLDGVADEMRNCMHIVGRSGQQMIGDSVPYRRATEGLSVLVCSSERGTRSQVSTTDTVPAVYPR